MTSTKLMSLLHDEASRPDFAPLDLAALTAEGDRRVRRRRWTAAAGAAVGVAAAVAIPLALAGGPPQDVVVRPTTPGVAALPLTWADDSVIHEGDTAIDVGHHIDAFVRTDRGFVVASDGVVYSVVDGEVSRVGALGPDQEAHLVSDPWTSRAGWIGVDGFEVLDQSGTSVSGFEHLGDQRSLRFYAIDGDTAYWRDAEGVVATDLVTKQTRVVDADPPETFDVVAAEDGVLAVNTGQGTWVGRDVEHRVELRGAYGDYGALSPDAAYYAVDADDAEVFDVRTGDRVAFQLDDYAFASAINWLDARHVAVIASTTLKGPAVLVTCTVPMGSCTAPQARVGDFADIAGHFNVPTGLRIG